MVQYALLIGLVVLGFLDKPWGWIIPGALSLMLLSFLGGQWQLSRSYQEVGGATFFMRLPAALLMSALQWFAFASITFAAGKLAGWLLRGMATTVGMDF